jgi:DNA-binding transcriptional LysR family regulator
MEIQQLRYFVRAAERRSFRAAADSLYVSRAALSKAVSKLEGELGYPLFDRTRDGVSLTERGRRFYDRTAPLVAGYDRIDREVKLPDARTALSVGIPNSWVEFFSDAVDGFRAARPDLAVGLVSGSDAECNRRALAGEVDLVVSHLPLADMLDEGLPLASVPLYVAMSEQSPLASLDVVRRADLADQTVFYYSCGYPDVFWAPTMGGASETFINDFAYIYTRVFRNEGVMPTPLVTAPEYQRGIVYRPFEGPFDTVVMQGFIGRHVQHDPVLASACADLRDDLAAGA